VVVVVVVVDVVIVSGLAGLFGPNRRLTKGRRFLEGFKVVVVVDALVVMSIFGATGFLLLLDLGVVATALVTACTLEGRLLLFAFEVVIEFEVSEGIMPSIIITTPFFVGNESPVNLMPFTYVAPLRSCSWSGGPARDSSEAGGAAGSSAPPSAACLSSMARVAAWSEMKPSVPGGGRAALRGTNRVQGSSVTRTGTSLMKMCQRAKNLSAETLFRSALSILSVSGTSISAC